MWQKRSQRRNCRLTITPHLKLTTMESNLIIRQNKSYKWEHWEQALFTFRWSYADVGYQHYKTCRVTVMQVENDQADRVCFDIILN